jgi:hypothetical protein
MVAAAFVRTVESMEYCEFGVDVPGVRMTESLLAELMEGLRSFRNALSITFAAGKAGDMALRLLGDGMTRVWPKLVLSMSGVLIRAGGRKGEKDTGAGL